MTSLEYLNEAQNFFLNISARISVMREVPFALARLFCRRPCISVVRLVTAFRVAVWAWRSSPCCRSARSRASLRRLVRLPCVAQARLERLGCAPGDVSEVVQHLNRHHRKIEHRCVAWTAREGDACACRPFLFIWCRGDLS
jgi:hypothetical protein